MTGTSPNPQQTEQQRHIVPSEALIGHSFALFCVNLPAAALATMPGQEGINGVILSEDAEDTVALRRCQQGDISGLDVLVARYQLRAVRAAYLLVRDHAAAEDIVQDSFLRVFQASAQFHDGARFAPWFYRIVLNTARQYQRALHRRRESSLDAPTSAAATTLSAPPATEPPESAERAERRSAVLDVLMALTIKQREVLILRYYASLSDGDITRILGCPPGTVRWRLHTAHRAFERIARQRHPWLLDHQTEVSQALIRAEGGTN